MCVECEELRAEVERLRAEQRSAEAEYDRGWADGKRRGEAEVEKLKEELKLMTLYRDNAQALYESANLRARLERGRH